MITVSIWAVQNGVEPTWLALLGAVGAGSVLSAVITAISLIYQNRKNAEREQALRREEKVERQHDREHQLSLRQLDRRNELSDHWRNQRQAAFYALAHSLRARQIALMNALSSLKPGVPFSQSLEEADERIRSAMDGFYDDLDRLITDVVLVASPQTRQAAHAANTALMIASAGLTLYAQIKSGDRDSGISWEQAEARYRDYVGAVDHYLDDVRDELGTATSEGA